ncbi:hypothetical protein [Tenacibaculum maritimum]|uniref:hypothetical protein n=1 Tax=Tenacibaculum maritimum TaxID=107401 RepID=UPI0010A51965|nr:hypothetical protein [Tenacibaculum maritimum]MCD9583753.1 hypothetical protein [Tenacibaculum maritimum]MCD9610975.1 hypothetical protein [Tenacibaculum maritimum]MCD9619481.1 hypothetical protein [Tenacibaculum maritimum]MCD9626177.1 hypothetical protein [Tenacibaculum maritimum]MCD9629169.1 hypothetical protein [Tenacibaculum maritimum]
MSDSKKNRIKASSLYESVISIAIISMGITLGMVIFFNVTNNVYNQVPYHQMLSKIDEVVVLEVVDKREANESSFDFKGYHIIRKRKKKGKSFFLEIVVFKKGKVILKKEYVLADEKSI